MRGFDPRDIAQFRELAKLSTAIPNVGTVPGSGVGPKPNADPGPTVYRIAPPPAPAPIAPPAAGVKRVLVGIARTAAFRGDVASIGAAITDSLRRAIAARPDFDVVDAAMLTDPRVYPSRTRNALARSVGAGAVLTALYFPRPDSTMMLQLQLYDVSRGRVLRVLESKPIDGKDPMRAVSDVIAMTLSSLDDVEWRAAPVDSSAGRRP